MIQVSNLARIAHGEMVLFVMASIFAPLTNLYAQTASVPLTQTQEPVQSLFSTPYTMIEREGVNDSVTWSFLGLQGIAKWSTGETASLYFRSVKINDDKSVSIEISRADPMGASAGLTAVYKGIWQNGQMSGDYVSSWPGRWSNKAGAWYAMTQPPLEIPSAMRVCVVRDCLTYELENGQFVNHTNLPAQEHERRVLTVTNFTRESISFSEIDTGTFPLTAAWSGKITTQGDNVATGTMRFTSWKGNPTPDDSPISGFRFPVVMGYRDGSDTRKLRAEKSGTVYRHVLVLRPRCA